MTTVFEIIYEASDKSKYYSVGLYDNYELDSLALDINYHDLVDDLVDKSKFKIYYESGKDFKLTNKINGEWESMTIQSRDLAMSEDDVGPMVRTVYIGRV